MTKFPLVILFMVLIISSCSIHKLNSVELRLKNGDLFPLDSSSVNEGEILRNVYSKGEIIDTYVCNKPIYLKKVKYADILDYHQSFANGVQNFKKYGIYNFKNKPSNKSDGIEYIFSYDGVISKYYFNHSEVPKAILKMDSLMMNENILVKP